MIKTSKVIDKNINIYKNINIDKNFNIDKNIDIDKNINIDTNINIDKNVNIDKNINVDEIKMSALTLPSIVLRDMLVSPPDSQSWSEHGFDTSHE